MRPLLGDELPAFLASLGEPPVRGLRLNPAKTDARELSSLLGVALDDPVPWAPDVGFVLPPDAPPLGLHPAHDAGLFYLQDPASMIAPRVLDPQPGWRVADVAAAPGGKTTALAASGAFVLANEVVRPRLRVLEQSLDRWGARDVVTCSAPLDRLPGGFDAVLLDAPCTGEALFRRDPDAARHWSEASVTGNARRQAKLLDAAARMVRPGGVLVYSTCSFEPAENEEQVEAFLSSHPDFSLEKSMRIWPHRDAGDGQYVARLVKEVGDQSRSAAPPSALLTKPPRAAAEAWRSFRDAALPGLAVDDSAITAMGNTLYLAPDDRPDIHLSRPGLPLGRVKPGRFEPAPALATYANPEHATQTTPVTDAYLRGETTQEAGEDGWVLVTYERWGLGWAKRTQGTLKNFFPKSQRRQ